MLHQLTEQKRKAKLAAMLGGPRLPVEPWFEHLDRNAYLNRSFEESMARVKPSLKELDRPLDSAVVASMVDFEVPSIASDEERELFKPKRVRRRNSISYFRQEPPLLAGPEIKELLKLRKKALRRRRRGGRLRWRSRGLRMTGRQGQDLYD